LPNSVIFLVAAWCTLTLGSAAMVWGPLKQYYGGARANPRSARGSGILCANPSNAPRSSRF
jgi:hypothetical protein